MTMKLKGKITITRQEGLSGCEFVAARLSLADFSAAITGMGGMPCEFELRAKYVGLRAEHKLVPVFVPNFDQLKDRDKVCRKAIQAYEVDGWSGRDADAKNNHRRASSDAKGTTYSVAFFRYVDDNGKPVE